MNFHVGQKVVCVVDGPLPESEGTASWWPTKGDIYTISAVAIRRRDGLVGVQIVEQPDKSHGFHAHRFRPLVSQADDVALFTHHLTDQPVDA